MNKTPRNKHVPENFPELYLTDIKCSKESARQRQAKEVLRKVIESTGLNQFNDLDYVRRMLALTEIQTASDEEIQEGLELMRNCGHQTVADDFEKKFKIRSEIGDEWPSILEEFKEKEAKLYGAWREEMITRGLEHPFLNRELRKIGIEG